MANNIPTIKRGPVDKTKANPQLAAILTQINTLHLGIRHDNALLESATSTIQQLNLRVKINNEQHLLDVLTQQAEALGYVFPAPTN